MVKMAVKFGGAIGVNEYSITQIHDGLKSGKFSPEEYAIDQFYPPDYDYKTSHLITRINEYVHRFKVGDKPVVFIINYSQKIWTCQIIGYYNNPFALEMGGQYESLQHYIDHQENKIREEEIKNRTDAGT